MAAQFGENKTRTLAQSNEPALCCFPGAAQALAAAASTLCLVGLARQSQETGSLCVCQTWQANISLVASKRGLPKPRNRHDTAAIVWYCAAKETQPAGLVNLSSNKPNSAVKQAGHPLDTRWALVVQSSGLADSLTAA